MDDNNNIKQINRRGKKVSFTPKYYKENFEIINDKKQRNSVFIMGENENQTSQFNKYYTQVNKNKKSERHDSLNNSNSREFSLTLNTIENPLEIPPEDLLFNHPLLRPNAIKKKTNKYKYIFINDKNLKEKEKVKMNKTHKSLHEKFLGKIYKKNIVLDKKVHGVRKNKKNFNLKNYQNLLLQSARVCLSKESVNRLNNAFGNIRNECHQEMIHDYKFLRDVEKQEKKIIHSINKSRRNFLKIMSDSFENDKKKENKTIYLPIIKFQRIKFGKKNK